MKIIGIDYGRKKIGVALSINGFVEPIKVLHLSNYQDGLQKIRSVVESESPEKIVVGVSEGEMGLEIEDFADDLAEMLSPTQIELFDETLSTKDANFIARESGVGRKKLKEMEDAYAATIMLQNYLDSSVS